MLVYWTKKKLFIKENMLDVHKEIDPVINADKIKGPYGKYFVTRREKEVITNLSSAHPFQTH